MKSFTSAPRPNTLHLWLRKFAKIGVLFFLCLALFLAMNGNAFAYTTEGGRWNDTPTAGCCADIGVQFNSFAQGYDRTGFNNAISAWNSSPANVYLEIGTGALTVQDTSNCSASWDGITYENINVFGYFTYANAYLNSCSTKNYSASTIQGVAAHELGHAIGLGHQNGCVLMTPDTSTRDSCGINTPQQDDVNGINYLY